MNQKLLEQLRFEKRVRQGLGAWYLIKPTGHRLITYGTDMGNPLYVGIKFDGSRAGFLLPVAAASEFAGTILRDVIRASIPKDDFDDR